MTTGGASTAANAAAPVTEPPDKRLRRRQLERAHHLLIVTDESCGAEELSRGARERANSHTTIRFVVPVNMSRAHLRNDGDASPSAREKLEKTLECLGAHGLAVSGRLGSADPVAAIEEALVDFPADEILLFTGPDEESWWLHKEALERAHARFHLPIAQVVLSPPREPSF